MDAVVAAALEVAGIGDAAAPGNGCHDDVSPALLAEPALADWLRPEEDEAWAHLQPAR